MNDLSQPRMFSPAKGEDLSQPVPQRDGSTLWEIRTGERPYALLSDPQVADTNRYGQKIDLIELVEEKLPRGRSMKINGNEEVGCNPNRNKQHAFFFTADNCIGCHACESACAEKNETPAHLSFRSVGYVEGGSYPDYKRLNISMACNHCDDPVCLKGCPTAAYTKHTEYGAVLQDPDTCFGCGYCTWVCPYNAPQLDPIMGQVSKCNMCVDRLEVGLKPACVSACVGNALDFGVVENIPENREEAKVSIPGFPDPAITHPNIRFQQVKTLPDEMKRTDTMPVKYHRDAKGNYRPRVDPKKGMKKSWNLRRLSSRENPLVLFTLAAQGALGAFAAIFLGAQFGVAGFGEFAGSVAYAPLAMLCLAMVGFGLFMSTLHLGKPLRFYRGFNNLRHSPVAREGLGIAVFMGFLALHILANLPANSLFASAWQGVTGSDIAALVPARALQPLSTASGYLALAGGAGGLYYMMRCYRIKARPFWNHAQVYTAFGGAALALGSLVAAVAMIPTLMALGVDYRPVLTVLGGLFALGAVVDAMGLFKHGRDMAAAEHEGAASHYIQRTTFGKTYLLRNGLLGFVVLGALALALSGASGPIALTAWGLTGLVLVVASLMGRALFYVLVVPTTMPGAFFWKNKGFEQHARDIGLADMPQVGVVPNRH
ncbi:MAG TPA: DmsC/YnfH family molybdoenzyme membrane anchor subunit [Porticoccaceae bacterium]|nr:DmsC/YnfH family molybdoenzyme membrane anchor subunit [Porticoccaceae bacterium]